MTYHIIRCDHEMYISCTHVAVTVRKQTTVSGLIQVVISLECFIEITPDFLCFFMND